MESNKESEVKEEAGATEPTVKVIKRYQNRKLYDTDRSCYVTLNEIAELIKAGEDVKVIDNKTKRDLTSLTLAQIIFEEEKKRKKVLPLGVLKNIIQTGGESLVDFWKKSVHTSVHSVSQAQEEVEAMLQKLVAKGSISKDEGQRFLQNVLTFSHKHIDDFQSRVEDQTRETVSKVFPGRNLREEFQSLQDKIERLEKKISELEG